jgi:hypothetical protein
MQQFLAKHSIVHVIQPHASPDVGPHDILLFLNLNSLIFDVETTEQILKIPETQFERYFKH